MDPPSSRVGCQAAVPRDVGSPFCFTLNLISTDEHLEVYSRIGKEEKGFSTAGHFGVLIEAFLGSGRYILGLKCYFGIASLCTF